MKDPDQGHWDDIVSAVRAGRIDQFSEIVSYYQEALRFTVAHYFRGDKDRIDELVHVSFLKAFQALDRFELGRPLGPWLRQIARHEALRAIRDLGREAHSKRDLIQVELARMHEESEESLERLDKLQVCLERLRDSNRELVRLHYFERVSLVEIARRLGRSMAGLRVSMMRIRRQLKTCIDGEVLS